MARKKSNTSNKTGGSGTDTDDNDGTKNTQAKKGGGFSDILKGAAAGATSSGVLLTALHWLLEKVASNQKVQDKAIEKLGKVFTDGRTRQDEATFISSLFNLKDIDEGIKILFLRKHLEMMNPDFTGRSIAEIAKLREKQDRAKGLVFLIEAAHNKKGTNAIKTAFVNSVWQGIFLGVDTLSSEAEKLSLIEDRIIHFGKNSQERMTTGEVFGRVSEFFSANPEETAAQQRLKDALRRKFK